MQALITLKCSKDCLKVHRSTYLIMQISINVGETCFLTGKTNVTSDTCSGATHIVHIGGGTRITVTPVNKNIHAHQEL